MISPCVRELIYQLCEGSVDDDHDDNEGIDEFFQMKLPLVVFGPSSLFPSKLSPSFFAPSEIFALALTSPSLKLKSLCNDFCPSSSPTPS